MDLIALFDFSSQPPWIIAWQLFLNGGWIIFAILGFFAARVIWLNWRQNLWLAKQEFTLLAIDIPKEHEQPPKAMEQFFAQLWGAFKGYTIYEKWWKGMYQLPFSVEIVSLEGYVQFIVRLPAHFRDLVEAGIYAQYPGAEVMEVQDYVTSVPKSMPSEGWDLSGTEFRLAKSDVYPIKTYPLFEHSLNQTFVDPLAAILEIMASAGPGEQVWLQWVITPIHDGWQKKSVKEAKKLSGAQVEAEPGPLSKLLGPLATLFRNLGDIIYQGFGSELPGSSNEKSITDLGILRLTPGETDAIKAIQQKAGKIGFQTKMRFVYVGRKESFNKAKCLSGIMGGFRQYAELNLNALKPHGRTFVTAHYVRVKQRIIKKQNSLLRGYRNRSQISGGGSGFILNTEELASLWHFPSHEVPVPRLKRAEAKKAEPPAELPIEDHLAMAPVEGSDDMAGEGFAAVHAAASVQSARADIKTSASQDTDASAPPANLPIG